MTGARQRPDPDDDGPRPAVLIAIFGAAVLLFNFPLLTVWNVPGTVFGLPILPVALFAIWGALVAVLAFVSERRGGRERGP